MAVHRELYKDRRSIVNKVAVLTLLFLALWLPNPALAQEDKPQPLNGEPVLDVGIDFMEDYWSEIEDEVEEYFPSLHWREIFNLVRDEGGGFPGLQEIFDGIIRLLVGEILLNFSSLGKLLVLAVLAAFLKNMQSSFENQGVAWITQGVVLLAMVGLILPGFIAAVDMAAGAIDNMVDFILSLVPVLIVLLSSLGSFTAAAIFHPVIVFSVYFFSTVIRNVIFPLIFLSVGLALVNHFSPRLQLEKLAGFLKDLCGWGLGLLMTIFVGVITLQGVAGTVTDAITLRTAKFLSGTFIPVVGKMLADSVGTVAGASLLLKNSAGLAGLVILGLILLFPFVKLLVLVIVYKGASALTQVVGESSLGDCLNTMGNCLVMVLASLAGISLMFFLAVVIIVGSGNALLMLR